MTFTASQNGELIVIMQGGLGNQLFIYATAVRLARINNLKLVIDTASGFRNDHKYQRLYRLSALNINECLSEDINLVPLSRGKISLYRKLSSFKFFKEKYIFQSNMNYDASLMKRNLKGRVYLDGYWQSEKYFVEIKEELLKSLTFSGVFSSYEKNLIQKIKNKKSLALHYRFFESPNNSNGNNVDNSYYINAIQYLKSKVDFNHVAIFAENPSLISNLEILKDYDVDIISTKNRPNNDIIDMQIMRHCNYFIIPNSTYSWWGAWLSSSPKKIVITPKMFKDWGISWWGFNGLIPKNWVKI